ncbi:hypothetical protein J2X52_000260 [Luteimonas sp. 3794]|nr:hypothetical protein [Luteimonas sp. 3794]
MLSRWRNLARKEVIVTKGFDLDKTMAAELKALREVKWKYERLKVEHHLMATDFKRRL